LIFEILETSALDDTQRVSKVIRECQSMGIAFALDDFGTGYSSLTYLKQLPAETLKIDRSFVHDMLTNRDDLAIVKGIIALAKAFRRKVIAEGVETRAHMDKLRRLGCESVQGFAIARPMPAADFLPWSATQKPSPRQP
jgi:EAL domain-containing protein (putative c-di-GMP-specific phosphodiesterase class I)